MVGRMEGKTERMVERMGMMEGRKERMVERMAVLLQY